MACWDRDNCEFCVYLESRVEGFGTETDTYFKMKAQEEEKRLLRKLQQLRAEAPRVGRPRKAQWNEEVGSCVREEAQQMAQ